MVRSIRCGGSVYSRLSLSLLSILFPGSLLRGNGIFVVSAAAAGMRRGRSQLVSVSAPWPSSCLSPLAEASEFVVESDRAGAFWDYVEALGDAPRWLFSCLGTSSSGLSGGGSGSINASGATLAGHSRETSGVETTTEETGVAYSAVPGVHDGAIMIDEGAVSAAAIRAAGKGFGGGGMRSNDDSRRVDDAGNSGSPSSGLGLDELSLRLLEVALSARSHAPAIESHRTLAAPTRPVCDHSIATPASTVTATATAASNTEKTATTAGAVAATPAAWVVFLPGGHVACSPKDLANALSGTCSTAPGDRVEGTGAGAGSCPLSSSDPVEEAEREGGDGDAVGDARDLAMAFDHVYHRSTEEDGGSSLPETTAILYGTVGSPTMMGFHRVLKDAAEAGAVRYVFRHALPYGDDSMGGEGETTPLQGYGVVLDVKNMEYRNLDDSSEKEGASAVTDDGGNDEKGEDNDGKDGALSIVEGEEVRGVVLATIAERRPDLKRELGILRQALLQEDQDGDGGSSEEELKVWNMGDLGLQALQSVAGAEDPLLRLEELSQNFPTHATALSALKVQQEARDEAQVSQYCFSELGLRHGSLYMNGKMLDLEGPTFNAFQILSMLRAEATGLRELDSICAPMGALAGSRGRSLLTAAGPVIHSDEGGGSAMGGAGGSSPNWRVDIIGEAKDTQRDFSPIVWLNDIEADHSYKKWSPALQQLAYQAFQMPRVRRNLCNMVVVLDPTTASGAEAMALLGMIVEQGIPARVGLVLTSQEDVDAVGDANDESWGQAAIFSEGSDLDLPAAAEEPPLAREVAELLSRLSEHLGSKAALSFVGEVASAQITALRTSEETEGGKEGDRFRRQDLAEIFAKLAGKKGPLSKSRVVAKPWTKAGASWGTPDDGEAAAVLPGAWAMARLCSSKGLSVQTWSVNGAFKGTLGGIRTSLMQAIMQENMLIAQLFLEGLVSDSTKDIYSRVLKHCGSKVHRRVHPALTSSLAEAQVVNLSSREALELVEGNSGGGAAATESEEQGEEGDATDANVQLLPPLDWLHPPGSSDSAKGISLLLVVNPRSADGVRTLEQALSLLLSSGSEGNGDSSPSPHSSLRLSVVFNPSVPDKEEGHMGEAAVGRWETVGEILPAILEAVGSRSPDKVPRFLLSVARAAISSSSSTTPLVDAIGDLAADAGLSPSLRAAVVHAAAAAGDGNDDGQEKMLRAARVKERRATLVRSVLGLDEGESSALVNGRRAIPARPGRGLAESDLSIAIETADDLGSFLVREVIAWDWGSWPEGSPQSSDPDLVNAQLQSNVVFRLASFMWRYHQESRKMIPGPDALSEEVARASSLPSNPSDEGDDNASSLSVRSVVHLVSSGKGYTEAEGVAREDGDVEEGAANAGEVVARGVDVELVAVLNPLSVAAQRASTLLMLARDMLGLPVTLLLTPELEVSELPLKNFYRLVLGPNSASRASFDRLPTRDILTQRLDTPEPWNVQASAALLDLDNLRCDSAGCGDHGTWTTSAEYTLKGLVLSGRCYDVTPGNPPSPPQGLQLVLRAPPSPPQGAAAVGGTIVADTVVMNNLGYFQLQAKPGVWELVLANGRGSDVYEIVGVASDGDDGRRKGSGGGGGAPHRAAFEVERRLRAELEAKEASPATEAQALVVRNFYSRYEPVLVRKRKGMEDVDLLEDEEPVEDARLDGSKSGGILSSVTAMMGFGDKEGDKEEEPSGEVVEGTEERVHVFSLATGHLYERLMKVMMMSVVKRCSVPVTFWLLENFLSPSFKESARALAEDYGFRVEFVTYKWPEWLRRQSEKQRIIWGYKILFLDVLFPLHLDKVIYVDADQVVRADLKELWDLDLKGAPYGYTPFCSSREETLGYQFWRGGFWKNHLMGRPYHISALYVVDLKVFRRRAVGDSLRSMYNALSADPNSLSNLDQDLPNYAQKEVPIFSLPQEWLWCETWCSDESKVEAKTIDLCNNPQHKEPKLDMAKRVISGPLFKETWVELDAEVRAAEDARRGVHEEAIRRNVTVTEAVRA